MAAKKELQPSDPQFLPTEYDLTKAKIAKLKKDYDPVLIPEANEKGDEGYLVIHEKVMAITKIRTAIEKKRKELKADSLAWGKKVDEAAREFTEIVQSIEEPWKEKKTALDEEEARKAEEARKKEAARIAIIEGKVEQLKSGADGLLGMPVQALEDRKALLDAVVIDETYEDYQEAAELYKAEAINAITKAIEERKVFEANQAALKAQEEKMAERQRKMDEQQAALDRQREEQEAAEQARKQAEADAEAARLKAIADKENAEREEEERARQEQELRDRLPEDTKVRNYAKALSDIALPEVSSEELKIVLVTVNKMVDDVVEYVNAHTQETE